MSDTEGDGVEASDLGNEGVSNLKLFSSGPAWKAWPLLRIRCSLRDLGDQSFANRRPSAATRWRLVTKHLKKSGTQEIG